MSDLPRGEVTFLFTDIVGSGRLWEDHPERMRSIMRRHNVLVHERVHAAGGTVIKERAEGDSVFAVFPSAPAAIQAALDIQLAVQAEPWDHGAALRLRATMHAGVVTPDGGDYIDPAVNRCSYLLKRTRAGEILLSEATRARAVGALPQDAAVHDLGVLRLKHGIRLRAWRLTHPDLNVLPDQGGEHLPLELTRLVGRERDVREVESMLDDHRLVTLVGAGGTGKSRIALRVAHRAPEAFRDGARWLPLASIGDASRVPEALVDQLGARCGDHEEPLAAALRHLGQRQLVLVLDNAEHLLDACCEVALAMLGSCPDVRVLVTSRTPLGASVEQIVPVTPLRHPPASAPGEPEPDVDPNALMSYEAVELFVERASERWRLFRLDETTAEPVATICSTLDGHPLAIELAAAQVGALPIAVIAEQVRDCLSLPRSVVRSHDPRHDTLASALEWSLELLSEEERLLFQRLHIFKGGCDLSAVAAVSGTASGTASEDGAPSSDLLNALVGLVDASLVQPLDGGDRYTMLEPIRQFAQSKARGTDGLIQETRARHAEHYVSFAEATSGRLRGSEQAASIRRLDREQSNLYAAAQWSWRHDGAETGLRIGVALWRYWHMRGRPRAGMEFLEAGLAAAPETLSRSLLADALHAAGTLSYFCGRSNHAEKRLSAALKIRTELGDRKGQAASLNNLGMVAVARDDFDFAETLYKQSQAIKRELGDRAGVATSYQNLAQVAKLRGHAAEALELAQTGSRERDALGDDWGLGHASHQVASYAMDLGRYDLAKSALDRSLDIQRRLKDRRGEAWTLTGMGGLLLKPPLRNVPEARRRLETALRLHRAADSVMGEIEALQLLAMAEMSGGELRRALHHLTQAIRVSRTHGRRLLTQSSLSRRADVLLEDPSLGDPRADLVASIELTEPTDPRDFVEAALRAALILALESDRMGLARRLAGALRPQGSTETYIPLRAASRRRLARRADPDMVNAGGDPGDGQRTALLREAQGFAADVRSRGTTRPV